MSLIDEEEMGSEFYDMYEYWAYFSAFFSHGADW